MKVKVLNYVDCDNGEIMDTFVFKEEANIEEIKKNVQDVFEEKAGVYPYIDIIYKLYGHLMLDVVEESQCEW